MAEPRLDAEGGRTVVERRPKAGNSCETIIVDDSYVIRRPPPGDGIFPVYDLALQTAVINTLRNVPTPRPATFENGEMRMPFVAGRIPHDFTPIDKWLGGLPSDDDRHHVWASTIDTIAAIHRETLIDGLRVGLRDELAYWGEYVSWMGAAPPQLLEVFDWCVARVPLATEPSPVLLWGDVRFGNIVYDETTLEPKTVLDWDMVSAGPPEMDIAWLTALTEVGFAMTQMRLGGFGSREDTIAAFQGHLGRPLVDFDWYETFALFRASAISTRLALLAEQSGEPSMFKVGDDPTLQAALARLL